MTHKLVGELSHMLALPIQGQSMEPGKEFKHPGGIIYRYEGLDQDALRFSLSLRGTGTKDLLQRAKIEIRDEAKGVALVSKEDGMLLKVQGIIHSKFKSERSSSSMASTIVIQRVTEKRFESPRPALRP